MIIFEEGVERVRCDGCGVWVEKGPPARAFKAPRGRERMDGWCRKGVGWSRAAEMGHAGRESASCCGVAERVREVGGDERASASGAVNRTRHNTGWAGIY
jgi:hypothetical protein